MTNLDSGWKVVGEFREDKLVALHVQPENDIHNGCDCNCGFTIQEQIKRDDKIPAYKHYWRQHK